MQVLDAGMANTVPRAFDAIIVGAGPAGSTAAIQLARAGWSVALVERQRFPRRKVCGGYLAATALPLLRTLGVQEALQPLCGSGLRQLTLMQRDEAVSADLPASAQPQWVSGPASGPAALDSLLLAQARAAGAAVFQPWAMQNILGQAGAWHCELRATEPAALLRLRAKVVIDAHGSWDSLSSDLPQRRPARSTADLFAFQGDYRGAPRSEGMLAVLALDGGYGSLVMAEDGTATVACCVRSDRLSGLRSAAPGLPVGEVLEAWLLRECPSLRAALEGASRSGSWLSRGPLHPGARVSARSTHFQVGNAAGEAHPILGDGIPLALQSAELLCALLLGPAGKAPVPDAARQATLMRDYAAAWRQRFQPRLRVAGALAQLAMRPRTAALLLRLARAWPGLLAQGARWGGQGAAAERAGTPAPFGAAPAP